MARTKLEIIEHKIAAGQRLPKWATPDGVIDAFEELLTDLECGLMQVSFLLPHLDEIKGIARDFRCLEYYDRIVHDMIGGDVL